MRKVQVLVIRPDGVSELTTITPELDEFVKIVGGHIEIIAPAKFWSTAAALEYDVRGYTRLLMPAWESGELGRWHAYLNEEGKLRGMEVNHVATEVADICGRAGARDDILVGPVVFLGTGDTEDTEESSVPDWLIQVAKMAGPA